MSVQPGPIDDTYATLSGVQFLDKNLDWHGSDRGLQAEGRADEVKSNLKQVGEKVKDAFRGRGTRRRRRY